MMTAERRSAHACDCYCCDWERERARLRRAGLGPWPDRPIYTSEMRLECGAFRQLGPVQTFCRQERDWWDRHGPHALRWMRELIHLELDDDLARSKHGAEHLLGIPCDRSRGILSPHRPPFSWAAIDAREIFFDGYLALGLRPGWSAYRLAQDVGGFATYLIRVGLIPPRVGGPLLEDIERWAPTWVAQVEGEVEGEVEGSRARDEK